MTDHCTCVACPECEGSGELWDEVWKGTSEAATCPACEGSGVQKPCPYCAGLGDELWPVEVKNTEG